MGTPTDQGGTTSAQRFINALASGIQLISAVVGLLLVFHEQRLTLAAIAGVVAVLVGIGFLVWSWKKPFAWTALASVVAVLIGGGLLGAAADDRLRGHRQASTTPTPSTSGSGTPGTSASSATVWHATIDLSGVAPDPTTDLVPPTVLRRQGTSVVASRPMAVWNGSPSPVRPTPPANGDSCYSIISRDRALNDTTVVLHPLSLCVDVGNDLFLYVDITGIGNTSHFEATFTLMPRH